MPTKLPRLTVVFPNEDLYRKFKKDADLNFRTESSHAAWIMAQYYFAKEKEAELFTPTQLNEAGREKKIPPVFRTPDQTELEQPSKKRASGNLGKTE